MYTQFRGTRARQTVRRIAEMIQGGEYAPGDRLPSERQLAEQLQVGRTSVREAIRRLEAIGLVESRHGIGTFVKDPRAQLIRSSLAPHLITDVRTQQEIFELRMIMEVEAAARAAVSASRDDIETMRRRMEEVETAIARLDMQSMIIADVEFHRQLFIATGNETLLGLMDSIIDLLRDVRRDGFNDVTLHPEIIAGHRDILRAVEARRPEAARKAMRKHLQVVRDRVMGVWPASAERDKEPKISGKEELAV